MPKGRLTVNDKSMMKKMKNIENLMNGGYEWDVDRNMGVRMTEDKISIKF